MRAPTELPFPRPTPLAVCGPLPLQRSHKSKWHKLRHILTDQPERQVLPQRASQALYGVVFWRFFRCSSAFGVKIRKTAHALRFIVFFMHGMVI